METKTSFFARFKAWRPIAAIINHIRNKLMVAFFAVALIPLTIAGLVAFTVSYQALQEQTFGQLTALQTVKANTIQQWLTSRRNDVKTLSENPAIVQATNDFLAAIAETGDGNHDLGSERVRSLYLGQSDLATAGDTSSYTAVHAQWHPFFQEYGAEYAYHDIYLIDKDGDIVYSTEKEDDFGTNLMTGPYADTSLADAFRQTVSVSDRDFTMIEDFAVFPISGEPESFITSPIIHNGEVAGVLAFEMPIDRLNAIMQESTGMGDSGETYLVGADYLFRSDSRFAEALGVASTVFNPDLVVNTTAVNSALAGNSGIQTIQDYRGTSVLSSWSPLVVQPPTATDPNGITWAVLAEIDSAEVNAPIFLLAGVVGALVLISAFVVVGVSVLLANNLTRQVDEIDTLFGEIGMGDFDARATVVSTDELGQMAEALNAMLDNTLTLIQSREERDEMQQSIMKLLEEIAGLAEGDLTIEAEVTADMTGAIADSFNLMIEQLRDIISNVQDATLQVSASANEIQATAEHLASGSESQAGQIIDTSAAIDEMTVSIQQVSENAALSAAVGEQATTNAQQGSHAVNNTIQGMNRIREQVQETSKRIKRLGESSQEIGEIVHLIGDIADRTSILALNASIQAAMAGDAGRGFAVVAEEVERLAERSTEATKQIDTLIRTIQNETYEAVSAMETMTNQVVEGSALANEAGQALTEIEGVSQRLSELIQSISQASKQQARGSETIARAMNEIADVTQQTAAGTKQAAVSINNLSTLADGLRQSVSTFRLPEMTSSMANGTSGGHSRAA